MIDELVLVALHRPVAAGRVRVEPAARSHGDLGRRLHREIFARLDDDRPLATAPGDDRGPIFVITAPTRLAVLAATTRAATQGLLPTLLGLPLVARGVIEVIRFHRALQLALHLIGQSSIAHGHDSGMEGEMLISLARFSFATNPDKLSEELEYVG